MEKKRAHFWTAFLVIVILGFMFLNLISLALTDSGTTDEVAHIPAGYSYINQLDYRLNPEHPPLAKVLAGIPLQFLHLKGLFSNWSWAEINQWEAGWNLIYRLGNNADQILSWSRLPMILLTIGLGLTIFFWIKSLYGKKIALIILLLYAFCPTFLAHGHLVTTDIAATFGFVVAVWSFVHFLEKKTWGSLVWAGVLFGIAQTMKFSCFLLIPILFLILIVRLLLFKNGEGFWTKFWPHFGRYILILVIGFVAVWLIYTPFTWNMPPEVEHKVIEKNLRPDDSRTLGLRKFFHHFENNKITRPLGHYLLGLSLVFGRTAGGNNTYILGHYSNKGFSWYFPVAWIVKIPLAIDIFIVLGLTLLFVYGFRGKEDKWRLWYLFIPWLIYWLITLKGSLNIGIRHLLPTVPFIYLFVARTIHPIINANDKFSFVKQRSLQVFVVLLLVWYILSSILSYPFYLAYFNELTWGKPKYKFLVDSNLDWGQDLKRLANFVEKNNIQKIKIDYFGGGIPTYYIDKDKVITWHSDQGPATGWFAISATYFQFSKLAGIEEKKWDYAWLEPIKPMTIIGDSILVYNITSYDLINYPPKPLTPEIKISPEEAERKRQEGK